MEHVELLEALLRWLGMEDSEVTDVLLEASPNIRLALELGRTEDAHILDDLEGLVAAQGGSVLGASALRGHDVLLGHVRRPKVLRLARLMELPVLLDILNELDGVEHAAAGEFVEFPIPRVEHKFFLLHGQLLAGIGHDEGELLAVVGLVEVHQRHEITQISLILRVEYLILVVVHLVRVSKLRELLKEVVALLFLDLELAVFNVEIEDSPDILCSKLRNELVLPVPGDVRDITVLAPEELEDFADLQFGLSKLLDIVVLSSVR